MIEYNKFTNESGIYCFKNLINNKCYIGQAINLKKRLRAHFSAYKGNRNLNLALYKAFHKYGIENFDIFIVEFVDPNTSNLKEVLDSLEKKYIKEYNSYGENGYNMTIGGDAGVLGLKMTEEQRKKISKEASKINERNKKRIFARNLSEPKYYKGLTYVEASEKSGISRQVISKICNKTNKYPYSKGWTFAFDEITLFNNCADAFRAMGFGTYNLNNGRFQKGVPNIFGIKVQEIDVNGKIINEFPSLAFTAKSIGCSKTNLIRHITNNTPINNRYFIYTNTNKPRRHLTDLEKEKLKKYHFSKKVNKYTKDGIFLECFDSITLAAKNVNTDVKYIRNCCNEKSKSCKGFIWKFA